MRPSPIYPLLAGTLLIGASAVAQEATDTLQIQGNTTSTFESPTPDTATVTGVGTNAFTWGEPAEGSFPSSLEMGGGSFDVTVPTGVVFGPRPREERPVFSLGRLRYENGTVLADTGIDGVRLDTLINITTPAGVDPQLAEFPLTIIDQPNTDDPVESADIVLFPDDLPDVLFTTPDGVELTLERVGFGPVAGQGYVTFDGFFAFEESGADTEVLARFAPICEPIVDDGVEEPATVRKASVDLRSLTKSDHDDDDDDGGKVAICHIPPGNPDNAHTITVAAPAADAHLAHGDYLGACEDADLPDPDVEDPELVLVFVPNFGVLYVDATQLCNYVAFNWIQVVVYTPARLLPVGVTLPYLIANPGIPGPDNFDDGLPFYWDTDLGVTPDPDPVGNVYHIDNHINITINNIFFEGLRFADTPSWPGLEPAQGEFVRYAVFLVGILPDDSFDVLYGLSYASNYDGEVDEAAATKVLGQPVPGSGSGGVFDLRLNRNPEEFSAATRQLLVDAGARNVPLTGLPDDGTYDRDRDGVAATQEAAAPNFGDGNGDGIDDVTQPQVASLSLADGGTVTVDTGDAACTLSDTRSGDRIDILDISNPTNPLTVPADPGFSYPLGLLAFEAACRDVSMTLYFHGLDSLADYGYRAFGPTTPGDGGTYQWFDFPATFGSAQVGDTTVPTVSFRITDGGSGDITGADNRIVAVASGLAAAVTAAPVAIPTLSGTAMLLLAGLLGLGAMLALKRGPRHTR